VIELELLRSGDFTGELELSNHPDDLWKSGDWLVAQLSHSVVLTGWSSLQQKLGALLQVRLFKVEELENSSYHRRHAVTPPYSLSLTLASNRLTQLMRKFSSRLFITEQVAGGYGVATSIK